MSYEFTIEEKPNHLYVSATGERTRENVAAIAHRIIDACEKNLVKGVLVDVRQLTGRLRVFDSFMIVAIEFPRLKRLGVLSKAAIVDREENRARFAFFERISRNRGFNVRAFSQVSEATEWLRSSDTDAPE